MSEETIQGLDEMVRVLKGYVERRYGFIEQLFGDVADPELKECLTDLAALALNKWNWGDPLKNRGKWLEHLEKMRGHQPKEIMNRAVEMYIARLAS